MSYRAGETGETRGHHCNACREEDHERECPGCGSIGLGGPQGDPPGNCNPHETDRNGDEPKKCCESRRKWTVVRANQVIPRGNEERAARCDKAARCCVSGNASRFRNGVRRRPSFSMTSVPSPFSGLHGREIQSRLEEPRAFPAPMVFAPFGQPYLGSLPLRAFPPLEAPLSIARTASGPPPGLRASTASQLPVSSSNNRAPWCPSVGECHPSWTPSPGRSFTPARDALVAATWTASASDRAWDLTHRGTSRGPCWSAWRASPNGRVEQDSPA